ncbi:MAG TPA: hypothetical protein VJ508_02905 [Saprospiraceae bacterium]|nr:hypothetical protein [Saprospiraceae bacterium]
MKYIRRALLLVFIWMSALAFSGQVQAQCPMCKISMESNMRNGGKTGRGLNAGILYMLVLPYSLVGTIGYIWWRKNRRKEEDEVEVLP